MAFTFTMPQQISKSNTNANLSKLTKGIGEFYDEEKRIEIVLDENVKKKKKKKLKFSSILLYIINKYKNKKDKMRRNISKLMNDQSNKTDLSVNSKQEINLPKTFTTR